MLSLEIDEQDGIELTREAPQSRSSFHFTCVCGTAISTRDREGVCPKCGVCYDLTAWGK